jgi:hypothetical protein
MDRWSIEELHHGNLLNRFLEEAGYPTGKNWQVEATRRFHDSTRSEVISLIMLRVRLENISTAHTWCGAR